MVGGRVEPTSRYCVNGGEGQYVRLSSGEATGRGGVLSTVEE